MTNTQNEPVELRECPLCKSDEVSHGYTYAGGLEMGNCECHSCGLVLWKETEAEAIEAWNTRPASSVVVDALREDIRHVLRDKPCARTEVVCPVNGARPYSYVEFLGQRVEFQQQDAEVKYHNGQPVYDAATSKAAAYAQLINDTIYAIAEGAYRAALANTPKQSAEVYLVWSNEHRAWWRPDSCGYTIKLEAAGRYTREEAIGIAGGRLGWIKDRQPDEIPVLERDALDAVNGILSALEGERS